MNKILVLNCGSSSIKYKLFEDEKVLYSGLIEKIGEKGSKIKSHEQGIKLMFKELTNSGKIKKLTEITAVGHRVVHGGNFSKSCVIDKRVIGFIKKYSSVAPLHNPVNLKGIVETKKILPKIIHVAIFDTAFHQSMPEFAYIYGLPYKFYKKDKIRRYGFHGISHQYVALRASKILKKRFNDLNLITCHLGAGCSITAIRKGKVVDTSMGFTPLEGLVMGTRTGDIDPGILIYLVEKKNMTFRGINNLLNKKSGLTGISGLGKDMRLIIKNYRKGNKRCKLALEIFCYRIKKYIGAYAAALGKVDAIVFTAGIGEHVPLVREWSANIKCLGIKIDKKNKKVKERIISLPDSKIKVIVIPTDEEKMIAMETRKIVK